MPALNLSTGKGAISLPSFIGENISFGLIYTNGILTAQTIRSSKNKILISETFRIDTLPILVAVDINEIGECGANVANLFNVETGCATIPGRYKKIYFEIDIEGGLLFSCKLLATESIQLEITKNHNIDFFSIEIGFFQDGNEFWLSNKMPIGSKAAIIINEPKA